MALQIKKFQAPTLQQAIEQIRNEMGDDAIILQTEPIKGGGMGLFGRNSIEVTAAIDRNDTQMKFHAMITETTDERPAPAPSNTTPAVTANKKNWLGLLGTVTPKSTEVAKPVVTAKPQAQPVSVTPAAETQGEDKSSIGQLYAVKTFVDPLKKDVEDLKAALKRTENPLQKKSKVKDPLEDEVHQLREDIRSFMLETKFQEDKMPGHIRQLMTFWKERGLSERMVAKILSDIENWGGQITSTTSPIEAMEQIARSLSGVIQEADVFKKSDRRIVVLVGPTGAGKTTTIAKMAAFEKYRLKRNVAFVTVDDFKIGGADQLAHYARILEVPVIRTRSDISLEAQIAAVKADTIFIDTFGFASRDQQRQDALKEILTFTHPDIISRLEVHLVLPVAFPSSDLTDLWSTYSCFHPQYLAFTKWDETQNWGSMLAAIVTCKKPVSFISHGQNVPDDFALFSKQSFIETVTSI